MGRFGSMLVGFELDIGKYTNSNRIQGGFGFGFCICEISLVEVVVRIHIFLDVFKSSLIHLSWYFGMRTIKPIPEMGKHKYQLVRVRLSS